MSVFLSPGIFDKESDFSTNVVGGSTTVVGMIGGFRKGPVSERTLVTNGADFIRKFGTPHPDSYAGLAGLQYLSYGRVLWVARIAGTSVDTAEVAIANNLAATGLIVSASSPGTWANNNLKFKVSDVTHQRASAQIGSGTNGVVTIWAADSGVGGNDYTVDVDASAIDAHALEVSLVVDALTVTLATESDGLGGFQLKAVDNTATLVATAIATLPEFTATASGTGNTSLSVSEGPTSFEGGEHSTFRAKIEVDGTIVEDHFDVHFDSTNTDGNYVEDVFSESQLVSVSDEAANWIDKYVPAGTYILTGGYDGITESSLGAGDGITITEQVNGIKLFSNTEDIDVNLLIAPGYSEPALINEMIGICETRGDCMAIIDPPLGLTAQEVVDWHNGDDGNHQAFNSSYAALYWDWLQVYDAYYGGFRWVPPSGFVVGAYAYNDNVGEAWFAPAGFIRGRLFKAINTRPNNNPGLGSRDFMYSGGNAVNPIVNFPQDGITLWGQRTLQRRPSATDRINVRRLLLHVRKAIVRSSRYLIFEQNDHATWLQWKSMVFPFLDNIKSRRGLYDFRVVMDETTVTPEDMDNNRMPGKVLLKPTKSAEFIPIDFVLYKTGVGFEE